MYFKKTSILIASLLPLLTFSPTVFADMEYYQEVTSRRGVQQPFWVIERDNASASLVLFAGGKGKLKISEDGIGKGKKNFLVRTRQKFAEHGFNVIIIDKPSDQASLFEFRTGEEHAQDIEAVIQFLRKKYNKPVWLVGTSRGTISAANAAARLRGANGPDGIVLTASVVVASQQASLNDVSLANIKVPTLFVHNEDDGCHVCPFSEVEDVMYLLSKVKDKGLQVHKGGNRDGNNECRGMTPHGFYGLETKVVQDIVDWIKPRIKQPRGVARKGVPETSL